MLAHKFDCIDDVNMTEIVWLAQDILSGVADPAEYHRAFEVYYDSETGEYSPDLEDELEAWHCGDEYCPLLMKLYAEMALEAAYEITYGEDISTILNDVNKKLYVKAVLEDV